MPKHQHMVSMLEGLKSTRARVHVACMCNDILCCFPKRCTDERTTLCIRVFVLRAKKTASAEERAAISGSSVSGTCESQTKERVTTCTIAASCVHHLTLGKWNTPKSKLHDAHLRIYVVNCPSVMMDDAVKSPTSSASRTK